MRKLCRIVLAAFSTLPLCATALAQPEPGKEATPLPREGAVEKTLCFSGTATPLAGNDSDRYGTYSVSGVAQSEQKAFDAMSTECSAAYEIRSGKWQHRGYCVFQDPSGDKYHVSDNWTTDGYKVVYLGGTGKFKGISGEGVVVPAGNDVKPLRAGSIQGCRRISTKYKLP